MIDVAVAYAAGTPAGAAGPGGFFSFAPIIVIFVIFYFLLIRPQQKKAKEQQLFLQGLKKGDNVVTSGGIRGVITGITDKVDTLEIADKGRIKVARPYILGTVTTITATTDEACSSTGGG
jgi:preprotein translocase subunit YajC